MVMSWINLSDLSSFRRHVAPTLAVDFLTTPSVQLMQGQTLPQGLTALICFVIENSANLKHGKSAVQKTFFSP